MKIAILISMLSWAPSAPTHADGEELLKKMDAAIGAASDEYFDYEMVDSEPGREERKLGLEVYLKGERKLSAFTAPADVRGTKVLIVSPTQMYVYMPVYKKVRRIASHVTEQGFLGTTYSNDDLSLTTYGDKYTGKYVGETDTEYKIELAPRGDTKVAYPRVQITMSKDRYFPLEIVYFNQEGTRLKTETRSEYSCEGSICSPGRLKMVDNTTHGHATSLIRKRWKVNSGLSERLFSVRDLQRED